MSSGNNLQSKYELNSLRSHRLARFILLGLAVEIIGVFIPPVCPWIPGAITIASAACIWIGVWGELHFSAKAKEAGDGIVAEANERVAQLEFESGFAEERTAMAAERAANAELETQRLKTEFAWRRVSEEQEILLRHALGKLQGTSVRLWHFMSDPESQNFAADIAAIFRLAGWQTFMHPAMFAGNFAFGIRVPLACGKDEGAAEAITEAFTNAGIEFLPLDIPEVTYGFASDNPLEHSQAKLYVGPKSKPFAIP